MEIVSVASLQEELLTGRVNRKPWEQSKWRIRQRPGADYWYRDGTQGLIRICESTRVVQSELRCDEAGSEISIGNDVFLGERAIVQAGQRVEIGDLATLGRGVLVMDRSHHRITPDEQQSGEVMAPVRIGERAYLGDYSVVLPGAVVPPDAIIPPCSVVTARSAGRGSGPYIRALNNNRLLAADVERQIRERIAYNQLVDASQAPLYNMFAVMVGGSRVNIIVTV